jgi:predicted metal-dependent peptidase
MSEDKKKPVTEQEKRNSLEWAINNLMIVDGQSFIAPILQCMSIQYRTQDNPTLAVGFNRKNRSFDLRINPNYFCHEVNDVERVALLKHEISHIIYKHVFLDTDVLGWKNPLAQVSADLVVNQGIKNLPKGALLVENFRDKQGHPLKKHMPLDYYYNAIVDNAEFNLPQQGQGEEQDGEGGDQEGEGKGQGKGEGKGRSDNWVKAKNYFDGKQGKFDGHDWTEDGASSEELLEATSDLIKRAMIKVGHDHSKIPQSIRDILEDIDVKLKQLNSKAILMAALKKSLPAKFQRLTWTRPSRRYGDQAKGRMTALMPRLEVFEDTSGSISTEELNEFMDVTRSFLTTGVEECNVNLFHTSNYYRTKMRKDFKLDKSMVQSGGTDLTDSFQKLTKVRCDLAIIVTDGYFSMPNVDLKKLPEMVFLISKGGTLDHPLAKKYKTLYYKP